MKKSANRNVAVKLLACASLLAFASSLLAQEPKGKANEDDPGKELIKEAYNLTLKSPQSVEDYTEIIDGIEEGLKTVKSESFAKYGKTLAAWAHFKRGELYTQGNAPDDAKALADFDAAVKLRDEADPKKPDWNYIHNRGVSNAIAGNFKEAMADFNRVIELRPTYGKEYFNRGELHSAQGNYREAILDYNRATRNDYNESVVFTRRGFAFFKLGDMRTAISQYGQAISRNNRDYEAYTYRGDARTVEGRYEQAVSDYQQAIRVNRNYARAYFSAAWLRATCPEARYRNADSALSSARRAIELGGETHRYLDCLAAAHARKGEFKEAVAAQQRAIAAAKKAADASQDEVEAFQQRLALYEKDQPYVAEAKPAAKASPSKAVEGSSSR